MTAQGKVPGKFTAGKAKWATWSRQSRYREKALERVAAPAKLRLRGHEDRFRLRVVMSRVAGKAGQPRLRVSHP